jgi:hypothetical protein
MTRVQRRQFVTSFLPSFAGDVADTSAVVAAAAAAGVLAEMAGQLLDVAAAPDRPPLPVGLVGDDGTCPSCSQEVLQVTDLCDRWWVVRRLSESGTGIDVYGNFEWGESFRDEHVACVNCGGEWATPADVSWV